MLNNAIPLTLWQYFRAPPESQPSAHPNYHIYTYGNLKAQGQVNSVSKAVGRNEDPPLLATVYNRNF